MEKVRCLKTKGAERKEDEDRKSEKGGVRRKSLESKLSEKKKDQRERRTNEENLRLGEKEEKRK